MLPEPTDVTNPPREEPPQASEAKHVPASRVGLWPLVRYFLRLGSLGFGGPIALVGAMRRDLVEDRRWFSDADYDEGLALAQLAPGPLAAQLAIYLGWVQGRLIGATLVALGFVIPSFLMVLVLSMLYLELGGLEWIQGAFYGIGAAVVAIISLSSFRLIRKSMGRDRLLGLILVANAGVTACTAAEPLEMMLGSGLVYCVWRSRHGLPRSSPAAVMLALPGWAMTGLAGPARPEALWDLLAYFAEAGAFVFGSGLAIVPFLHGGVVEDHGWLTEQQFLDAVAVAMITPGPVVITVAFIGFMVAGVLGAVIAAVGVFLPCYVFTVLPAPYFRQIARNRSVRWFVDGVTAAATGAIAGAACILARRALIDLPTLLIALGSLLALLLGRKVPEPLVILSAGLVGVALYLAAPVA